MSFDLSRVRSWLSWEMSCSFSSRGVWLFCDIVECLVFINQRVALGGLLINILFLKRWEYLRFPHDWYGFRHMVYMISYRSFHFLSIYMLLTCFAFHVALQICKLELEQKSHPRILRTKKHANLSGFGANFVKKINYHYYKISLTEAL